MSVCVCMRVYVYVCVVYGTCSLFELRFVGGSSLWLADLQLEQRSMNGTAVAAGDNPCLGRGVTADH